MLDYFNIRYTHESIPSRIRYWDSLKNNLKSILNKKKDYYNRNPYYVYSDHILGKYLNNFVIPLDNDNFSFYSDIKTKVLYVGSQLGITTPISTGIIHSGEMYGVGKDIIIGYNGIHNPNELDKNWDKLKPIQILRHSYKNIDIQPIVKQDKVSNTSVNVYLIDLVMLLFQYRGYLKKYKNSNSHYSVSNFLSRYPLNELLDSHMDMILLNNIYSKINNKLIDRPIFTGSGIVSYNSQLEAIRDDIYNNLTHSTTDIDKCLKSVPMLFYENLLRKVDLIGIDLNRYNSWGYIYSFLPHLKYALTVGSKDINRTNASNIERVLDRLKNDNAFNSLSNRSIKDSILNEINEIRNLI